MKKAARTTERALISRAQQIFSIRRRLAFLLELERRLKEQAVVLDAHKPARRPPKSGRLLELSRVVGFATFGCDWPSNWRRNAGSSLSGPLPSHLPLGAKADRQHPGRYPQSGSGARPGNSA